MAVIAWLKSLLMLPPWVAEGFQFLILGANSNWFGLVCPAHCTSSTLLIFSVFLAGFSTGVLVGASLLWAWFFAHQPTTPVTTGPRRPPGLRLAAYLHERPTTPH